MLSWKNRNGAKTRAGRNFGVGLYSCEPEQSCMFLQSASPSSQLRSNVQVGRTCKLASVMAAWLLLDSDMETGVSRRYSVQVFDGFYEC